MSRNPIQITDAQYTQIELMAGWGMSEEKIASILGISWRTFHRRKRDSVRVAAALHKGMAIAESYVGEALFKKAKAGDIAAIKYWENTRAGRAERSVQETVHRDYRQQVDEARARIRLVG